MDLEFYSLIAGAVAGGLLGHALGRRGLARRMILALATVWVLSVLVHGLGELEATMVLRLNDFFQHGNFAIGLLGGVLATASEDSSDR